MSNGTCQHCGCSEIDVDPSRGDAVCTNCGSVLEDNIIVSEVQFEENSHGGARAIGQLVTTEGQTPGLNIGFQYGTGKDSRMVTLQNARRKIVQVADQLRLNQCCIDTAYNFYKMALNKRFTRGRKNSHVIAACIYMVCRIEKTPHMLLDLSDIVQVNVYDLGKTYLRLSSILCIKIPALDPSLYISRFAHRLQFGKKTHEVSNTAMRLVQRMTRDWMHTGRRPSGLCGAALLVAARLHEFSRTVKDIIKIVRVCEATVRKRLSEFSETPSSRLTLDEFMNIDLEEEQDPPCFIQARKKQKQQQLEDSNEDFTQEISELQKLIEKALEKKKKKPKDPDLMDSPLAFQGETNSPFENDLTEQFIVEETIDSIQECVREDTTDAEDRSHAESGYYSVSSTASSYFNLRPTAASLGLKESIEDCMKKKTVEDQVDETGELDLTGLDEEELDSYLMTEEETSVKTELWMKLNAEYLKELKEREERKAKEEEENSNKTEQRKRKRQVRKRNNIQANSTREAIEMMFQERKLSRKINYEVLQNLYDTDAKPTEIQKTPDELPPKTSRQRAKLAAKGGAPPESIKGVMSSIFQQTRTQSSLPIVEDEEDEREDTNKKVLFVDPPKVEDTFQNSNIPNEKANTQELAEEDLEDLDDFEEEEQHPHAEEEQHLSAAQLLGQHRGEDAYYSGEEEYYD